MKIDIAKIETLILSGKLMEELGAHMTGLVCSSFAVLALIVENDKYGGKEERLWREQRERSVWTIPIGRIDKFFLRIAPFTIRPLVGVHVDQTGVREGFSVTHKGT
jgi:hypothetical protein